MLAGCSSIKIVIDQNPDVASHPERFEFPRRLWQCISRGFRSSRGPIRKHSGWKARNTNCFGFNTLVIAEHEMIQRRFPIGAEVQPHGVHFRVWAPNSKTVGVVIDGNCHPLQSESNGYFSLLVESAADGTDYLFQLNGGKQLPDPVSRFQPEGPHGPSRIVDPNQFRWTDGEWRGRSLRGSVVYEMHIGTFTPQGTWQAATEHLRELADVGINCIELMPVADFVGNFGWGYDGVNLFAPTRLYGSPEEMRRFIDVAHSHQIAVVLDVVYNHLGPDGNFLHEFSASYFTDRYETDWGSAINYDGDDAGPVREFFLTNATYWIDEFHLDGLRLDATQNIYDASPTDRHILTEIGKAVRRAAGNRTTLLIAENEPQDPALCRSVECGGYGLDAAWNDDYHHSAMVALTGRREAYYADYLGQPQEFINAVKYGYLYQGQWYSWQSQRRGKSGLDLPARAFVTFIQNHDQIANSGRGLRAHQQCSPARYRVLHALTLLMPGTPMLFQGQEFAASTPFYYFADHKPELAKLVQQGRIEFLSQFPSLSDREMISNFAAPHDVQSFERCKLNFEERTQHAAEYQLTKDLLALRRSAPGFQPESRHHVDGAVIDSEAFVLRYFYKDHADRLLVVNLGRDLKLSVVPEPLLAPPTGLSWKIIFSTEEYHYGGNGVRAPEEDEGGWFLSGESLIVLEGRPNETEADGNAK